MGGEMNNMELLQQEQNTSGVPQTNAHPSTAGGYAGARGGLYPPQTDDCPCCGRCPHCGRKDPVPPFAPYPWWQFPGVNGISSSTITYFTVAQ